MLIHERMQLVKLGLMLEMDLPSVSKDKRELIISVNGIPDKRNAVIALIRAAPKHLEEHWNFFAICGREPLCNVVSNWADGVVYPYENIKFAFGRDNEKKIAIMLFFEGYDEKNDHFFMDFAFKYLDLALGEYAVLHHVRKINCTGMKDDEAKIRLFRSFH
jgi:hypothetical protein